MLFSKQSFATAVHCRNYMLQTINYPVYNKTFLSRTIPTTIFILNSYQPPTVETLPGFMTFLGSRISWLPQSWFIYVYVYSALCVFVKEQVSHTVIVVLPLALAFYFFWFPCFSSYTQKSFWTINLSPLFCFV